MSKYDILEKYNLIHEVIVYKNRGKYLYKEAVYSSAISGETLHYIIDEGLPREVIYNKDLEKWEVISGEYDE